MRGKVQEREGNKSVNGNTGMHADIETDRQTQTQKDRVTHYEAKRALVKQYIRPYLAEMTLTLDAIDLVIENTPGIRKKRSKIINQ